VRGNPPLPTPHSPLTPVDILILLIPLSLVIVGVIAWIMLWAAKSGQFDDLEGPGHSVIMDDDSPPKPDDPPES
jgi:cbb3-type cytochrome oxidase maturation protein